MLSFGLNHMTVPTLSVDQLCDLGRTLNMAGIELRNDLDHPLDATQPADLTVFALAEVPAFNAFDNAVFEKAVALMDLATANGAQAIALIPQVGGTVPQDGLRKAMVALGPALAQRGLTGLIEPVGFAASTLRFKSEVVALIDTLDVGHHFGLIHDTFHHALAGEDTMYPAYTKMVHISGVTRPGLDAVTAKDADRVLVDADDQLGTVAQISEIMRGGYNGPLSFEVFSPDVHALTDRKAALSRSIRFIENEVLALAA